MAESFTLRVAKPFLYGRKVRNVGELVELDAHTAKDLLHRKRATIPGDEPRQAAPTPARATKPKAKG